MKKLYCGFCSTKIQYKVYDTEPLASKIFRFLSLTNLIWGSYYQKNHVKTRHVINKDYEIEDESLRVNGGGFELIVCENCFKLNSGEGSTRHLNDPQKKVFLKYGLIHPKVAVHSSKIDNTWQGSSLTLEDLNYRQESFLQQMSFGCLLVPLTIFFILVLFNDSLFLKFLGILGIIGLIYWMFKNEI